MHKELYIVKGIPATPNDSTSTLAFNQEKGQSVIPLMGGTNFALKTNGWTPQMAQFSGTWKESNLTDGRELIAGKDQNVIETMQLVLTTSTHQELYESLKILNRTAEDARLFHTTNYQLEPVYLKWLAECGYGYQYAIIYAMDVVPALVDLNQTPAIDITLTIEREPYWRGVVPGIGTDADAPFNYYQSSSTASNRRFGYHSLSFQADVVDEPDCRVSYVDIAAADIPGDAPALVRISFPNFTSATPAGDSFTSAPAVTQVMMSRFTRPVQYIYEVNGAAGTYGQLVHTNTLLATPLGASASTPTLDPYDIIGETGVAAIADAGGRGRKATCASADVETVAEISFSSTADARRIRWTIDPTVMTGTYAVFLRGGQRAGSLGDTSMYLKYGFYGDDAQNEAVRPALTPAAPTEYWPVNYMGTVDIPTGARRVITGQFGIDADASFGTKAFNIDLWASRSTGTATLRVQDLILMPIDEDVVTIIPAAQTAQNIETLVYDNTGAALRGGIGEVAFGTSNGSPELLGSEFTLKPGVDNRIYFFFQSNSKFDGSSFIEPVPGFSSIVRDPDNSEGVRGEVYLTTQLIYVPRWLGIRDA